jgi:hypothetical protein
VLSDVLIDVPAFDVTDRRRFATVGSGAEGNFQESAQAFVRTFGAEDVFGFAAHDLFDL